MNDYRTGMGFSTAQGSNGTVNAQQYGPASVQGGVSINGNVGGGSGVPHGLFETGFSRRKNSGGRCCHRPPAVTTSAAPPPHLEAGPRVPLVYLCGPGEFVILDEAWLKSCRPPPRSSPPPLIVAPVFQNFRPPPPTPRGRILVIYEHPLVAPQFMHL